MPRGTRAFTLIELLVVIGIIAILAMAMIPAYHSFKERAGYVVAKSMAKNIELAILAYEDEFKEWPVEDEGEHTFSGTVLDKLTGKDDDIDIMFFEAGTNEVVVPWAYQDEELQDYEYFYFMVDYNYDNKISYDGDDLRRRVIVWTYERDGTTEIRSWE